MFRRLFALVLLAALLPGCADLLQPKSETESWQKVEVGVVTQVKTEQIYTPRLIAEIFLEEDPTIPLATWSREPDGSSKTTWLIYPETRIFRQRADGSLVPAGLDEVRVGFVLRAETTRPYLLSLPPQAYADRIVLISQSP